MSLLLPHKITGSEIIPFRLRLVLHTNMNPNPTTDADIGGVVRFMEFVAEVVRDSYGELVSQSRLRITSAHTFNGKSHLRRVTRILPGTRWTNGSQRRAFAWRSCCRPFVPYRRLHGNSTLSGTLHSAHSRRCGPTRLDICSLERALSGANVFCPLSVSRSRTCLPSDWERSR